MEWIITVTKVMGVDVYRGNYMFNQWFWVNIDKGCNHLVPVCGAMKNSSAFTVTVNSDFFYTETFPITVVTSLSAINVLNIYSFKFCTL